MTDDYLGIVAICGPEGSGKTSMAISFPTPLRHMDVDVGGFKRAAWRLSPEMLSQITTEAFPRPVQISKLLGQQTDVSGPKLSIRFPKRVEGMRELWQQFVIAFVGHCRVPEVKTIVIDSATLLWFIDHNSILQELQDKQLYKHNKPQPFDENEFRERLQPVEYGPANDRMRTILHTARSFQKNLVLTHYPTDEYGTIPDGRGGMTEGKTGNIILDGFKETIRLVDLVVWTRIAETITEGISNKYPVAKITKCGIEGMGLKAVGMEIIATYEAFINLRNTLQAAQKGVASAQATLS